jgi:hypothetical protein
MRVVSVEEEIGVAESLLPVEVELVYEVMTCQATRVSQEPIAAPHPCSYFREWGTYQSYDYTIEGAPRTPGIMHRVEYVGRAPLVPELLSGCRKTPIMAVGINPNLPGWWASHRGSLNPLFDDFRQYAHYFRYRGTAKLELSPHDYERYGGSPEDTPFSDVELAIPADSSGRRRMHARLAPQPMYVAYQGLLDDLAAQMGWPSGQLIVGEDLSYGNMVASPSAKWTTHAGSRDGDLPAMTEAQRNGIVQECFRDRRYFLRQLFQSLPNVLLVFSQNTANAFIGEMQTRFTVGAPVPEESVEDLMQREIRLSYGTAPDGSALDARVIFAPHITGDPQHFAAARARVIEQLVDEAHAGRLSHNPATGHLHRSRGGCVFCPMLQIGPCDYLDELQPLNQPQRLTANAPFAELAAERHAHSGLLAHIVENAPPVAQVWAHTNDTEGEDETP